MRALYRGVALPKFLRKNKTKLNEDEMTENQALLEAYTKIMSELAERGEEFVNSTEETQAIILDAIEQITKNLPA